MGKISDFNGAIKGHVPGVRVGSPFLRRCDTIQEKCASQNWGVTFLASCHTCTPAQTINYMTHIKTETKPEKSFLQRK